MITFSLISLFVGAALGQRFKIRVLIPALAILVIVAAGAGYMHARSGWYVVLIVAINRYMSANRLFFWNWCSSSPSGDRLVQEVGAPNLLPHAGTTCRSLIRPCLMPY